MQRPHLIRSAILPLFIVALAATTGCDRPSLGAQGPSSTAVPGSDGATRDPRGGAARDDGYRHQPGYVVDSVLPVAEALRRFRADLPDAPSSLRNAATSREGLVRRFVDALSRADTAALRALAIDRGEFAWLVYPESPYIRPPYQQAPDIVWMMLQQGNASGLRRLLRDREEHGAWTVLSHRCDAAAVVEGANRLWRNCRLRIVRASGDTVSARLFGVVVEREGRFKFASYENDF